MTAPTRLFPPTGTTPTARERAFLRDVQRLYGFAEVAMGELAGALNDGDVGRAVAGSRRLQSVGVLLGEAAREVER